MIKSRKSISIRAPSETVWAIISDIEGHTNFQPYLTKQRITSMSRRGTGVTWISVIEKNGESNQTMRSSYTVLLWESPVIFNTFCRCSRILLAKVKRSRFW